MKNSPGSKAALQHARINKSFQIAPHRLFITARRGGEGRSKTSRDMIFPWMRHQGASMRSTDALLSFKIQRTKNWRSSTTRFGSSRLIILPERAKNYKI
jgi:hypothetical protein